MTTIQPWLCKVCSSENTLSRDYCTSCGAERDESIIQPLTLPPAPVTPASDAPSIEQPAFLLYPKNERFIYGKTTRFDYNRGMGCSCGMVGFMFFLIPLLILVGGVQLFYRQVGYTRELNETGQRVEGIVLDKSMETRDDSNNYYIDYQYTVNDQVYTDRGLVKRSTYQSLNVNDRVQVIYAPANPTNSELESDLEAWQMLVGAGVAGLVFVGLFMIGGVTGMYIAARDYDLRRELRQKGQIIMGQVLSCKGEEDSDDDYHITVVYHFVSPQTSQEIQKKETRIRNDLKKKPLPASGAPVCIIYASDRNYRLL